MKQLCIGLLVLALVLLPACGSSPESPAGTEGGILSHFQTTDLEGNAVDESIFSGYQLTMVNIWATFCTPCISEMPELAGLAETYAPKGVQIVGLISDGDSETELARSIVAETGADYRHLLPSADLENLLSQVYAVPTTIFVDESGRQVGSTYLSAKTGEEWAEIIDRVLASLG